MKKINLKDIKSGALLGKPEKVVVKFKLNGEDAEFETHVKPFNYDTAIANYKAYGENKAALAGIIASCLCDEDGKLILTEDDVRQHFNQALVDATWNEIIQVNALGKPSPNSTTTPKSASKSDLPSGELTAKSSKRSVTAKSRPTPPTSPSVEASTLDAG